MAHSRTMINKKKMVILAIIALLGVAFYQNKDVIMKLVPSSEHIDERMVELKREQKRFQRELIIAWDQDAQRALFKQNAKSFWITARDGEPETKIHSTVEEAAKYAGVQLRVLGNLRRSRVRDGLIFLEFNVAANATMKALAVFIDELEQKNPQFFWQRLSLRPGGLQTPGQMIMNGNLRFFVITDDSVTNYLRGSK